MKPSTRKVLTILAIVLAYCVVLYGGVGGMKLILMNAGIYDPVAADGLSPERVPALRTRLLIEIAVSFAVLLLAAGCWRKLTSNFVS